ncbi:ArsR/SmtB family transcription factor [Rhizobium paknamense]|uniref:DNA-binding transcriptional ArsR family regulator n=1 Tax=Rhizobium paknamense TaxID=1206817 RepID=A0ABU0II57_9HYPH|nr:metalloregulator ArsR/SmtB family transcription factor [Rhizobium paknamense]MDQ0457871.1 DNA-binding transcriptional ArsR family regulator [Rhizobium paknamense]
MKRPQVPVELLMRRAPQAAEFLRQFANSNRLILLCHIAGGECSVGEIQDALGIKQPGLSQQLKELRQAELVKTRRQGTQIYYSIADQRVEAMMGLLYDMFCDDQALTLSGNDVDAVSEEDA